MMGFRKPYILLKELGLTNGKQLVLSEKCRDSEDFRVMEDSLSQVIYLDWDKKDHYINYDKTRKSNDELRYNMSSQVMNLFDIFLDFFRDVRKSSGNHLGGQNT